jgi:hypothetical protein
MSSEASLDFFSEQIFLTNVVEGFCDTVFVRRIDDFRAHPTSGRPRFRLHGDCSDFCLVLAEGSELITHQIVLGSFALFFNDLFAEASGGQGCVFRFYFPFPFPHVLLSLIDLFYVMTNPDFNIDAFFAGMSVGGPFCYVLLLSVLSYLNVPCLFVRVRSLLCRHWPECRLSAGLDPIRTFFDQIRRLFIASEDALDCIAVACFRMNRMMVRMFSHWDEPPPILNFCSPFIRVVSRGYESFLAGPPSETVTEPPSEMWAEPPLLTMYGRVRDLSEFFAHCRSVTDWERGFFPTDGFQDPLFYDLGLNRLMIPSWYPSFFDWVCEITLNNDGKQRIISGSPGIGKSVFGLYFMARLIASSLTTFCGHKYFSLSWMNDRDSPQWARVTLEGLVTLITYADFQDDEAKKVFRLLDGYSYLESDSCWPCLSILPPSEFRLGEVPSLILYAPSLTLGALDTMAGVSSRYGLRDIRRSAEEFHSARYGSIESRMEIVGGNLRLLHSSHTLPDLQAFLKAGIDTLHFDRTPVPYFHERGEDASLRYLRLFSCLTVPPYDEPGRETFASVWAERLVNRRFYSADTQEHVQRIRSTPGWMARLLGFCRIAETAENTLFESLCHSTIGGLCLMPDGCHFDLVCWNPQAPGDLNSVIEQFQITTNQCIHGSDAELPRNFTSAWYWYPKGQRFPGIDSIWWNSRVLFLIQITIKSGHPPVCLDTIWPYVKECSSIHPALQIWFVTLVDSVATQRTVLAKRKGMIKSPMDTNLRQYVGVLHAGPMNPPGLTITLGHLTTGQVPPF